MMNMRIEFNKYMKRILIVAIMSGWMLTIHAQSQIQKAKTNGSPLVGQVSDTIRPQGEPPVGPPGESFPRHGKRGFDDGPGGPGGPGHRASAESKVSADGYGQTAGKHSLKKKTLTSENAEENAVQVKGGRLELTECIIRKPGADSDNGDGTSFYGTNAAVLATDTGTIDITGGSITTNAVGANGIVAYGGTVNVKNTTISCEKNLSRGIHATGGGVINAENLAVETKGNNSSVIATDRGGGVVTVKGGTYKTSGRDCAVCYSTGTITVNGIKGESTQGEVGVIEGDNVININDCQMTSGDNRRGMMILQSGSGDAEGMHGKINVTNGSITLTSPETPLIEITTNTEGTLTLKDVALDVPSGVLMQVGHNDRWRTKNPVAFLNLETASQTLYTGDIVLKDDGTATVTVGKGVTWTGAYDKTDSGLATTVIVNGIWNLTADSYVDTVIVNEGGTINRGIYTLHEGK